MCPLWHSLKFNCKPYAKQQICVQRVLNKVKVGIYVKLEKKLTFNSKHTCNSLIATHESEGNPWSIGTKNCRHPDQCPISNIIQIKLNILINTLAIFKN